MKKTRFILRDIKTVEKKANIIEISNIELLNKKEIQDFKSDMEYYINQMQLLENKLKKMYLDIEEFEEE